VVAPLKPFLKWAGGKRWLTSRHSHLLPSKYSAYHEPFLGSGAVFFHLQPKRAFLSDANVHLIECYLAMKEDWQSVWSYLLAFKREHSEEHYYRVREAAFRSPTREAARFIYLNRTCFNGIYRENLNGIFNVPKGTKDAVTFADDNFFAVSSALQSASLASSDFSVAINQAKKGDFIFIDPPYTVRHNHNGFVKYNQKIFSWSDQVRLRDAVQVASDRGVACLITNACHPSIAELYEGLGKKNTVSRSSVIAGASEHRGTYDELIITIGYDVPNEERATDSELLLKLKKKTNEKHI
jgi:DNA adenine methylase